MKKCDAVGLLEESVDWGFPTDYILSRIKGRRSRLVSDWKTLIASASPLEHLPEGHYQKTFGDKTPEAVWRALLAEYKWLYHQMNSKLRKILSPFFLYTELRTMFMCLRYVRELKGERTRELLSASLLCDEIKKILYWGRNELDAAKGIEDKFLCLSAQFSGMTLTMKEEGLKAYEQELTRRFLSVIVRSATEPLVIAFFIRMIDARNLLAVVKLLNTPSKEKRLFIPGGNVDIGRLMEILKAGEWAGADRLLREWTGEDVNSSDIVRVEASLYRGISRSLRIARRETLGIDPVLDYLWRCSIEAMNMGILSYGHKLKTDVVAAELVQ